MIDYKISELMQMQEKLQAAHPEWTRLCPKQARNQLLYMVEELGEVISIIKKKGEDAIMQEPAVRANLCTELCDILMYFTDSLLCYEITPEELCRAYQKKHEYNVTRNYDAQNAILYSKKPEENEC